MVEKNDPIVVRKPLRHYYVPMIQKDLINYEVHSFLPVCDARYRETASNKKTKWAVYLD